MEWLPPVVTDFELLRPIGRGGYGDVWLARSITGRWRAVKLIHRDRFESERPFEREFLGIQQFEMISHRHPSQLRILHVGRPTSAGFFYYVMELADDREAPPSASEEDDINPLTYSPKTLRTRLQTVGRLGAEETLTLGERLAEAVHYLHSAQLIHRDIKPSNIIFVRGRPKLADIGLVTGAEAASTFVGTKGFVPPEGPGSVHADVYALGKVLYEAATGLDRLEFPRLPADLEERADRGPLMELNEVWLKACDPEPANRYASAASLRHDLLLISAGSSMRRWRWVERRLRVVTGVGAALTALVLVAIALGLWANRERLRATQAERDLSERYIGQQLALARATRLTGLPGQRVRTLEILRAAAEHTNSLELRNEAIAALALPDLLMERGLPPTSGQWVFDPDLTCYATNDAGGGIQFRSLTTHALSQELPPYRLPGVPTWLTGLHRFGFAPEGQAFGASYTNHDFLIWRSHSSSTNRALPDHSPRPPFTLTQRLRLPRGARAGASVPGSSLLVTDADDEGLHFFNTETATETRVIPGLGPLSRIAFCPDGRQFVQWQGDKLILRELPSGAVLRDWTTGGLVLGCVWHPDGMQLITWSSGSTLRLWNSLSGTSAGTLTGHEAAVVAAHFDASGQWLLTTGWDNQMLLWSVARRRPVLRWPGGGNGLQLSREGNRAVVQSWLDHEWKITDLSLSREMRTFEPHPKSAELEGQRDLWRVAFLDNQILIGANTRGLSVWNLNAPQSPAFIEEPVLHAIAPAAGERLLNVDGETVYVRRVTTLAAKGPIELALRQRVTPPELGAVKGFAASDDLTTLAAINEQGEVRLRQGRRDTPWHSVTKEPAHVLSLDREGTRLAATFLRSGFEVWDTHDLRSRLRVPDGDWKLAQVSPDGQWIAAATQESFEVWDLRSGQRVHRRPRQGINGPLSAWTPDSGSLLVNDAEPVVRLLRTGTWLELAAFPAPTLLRAPAFSADGKFLALPGEKSGVQVWDLAQLHARLRELGLDWP